MERYFFDTFPSIIYTSETGQLLTYITDYVYQEEKYLIKYKILVVSMVFLLMVSGREVLAGQNRSWEELPFKSSSVQTGLWLENAPVSVVISSKEQLTEFQNKYPDVTHSKKFTNKYKDVSEDFFSEKILLCGIVSANSGGVSYRVNKIEMNKNGKLRMVIRKKSVDNVATTDMSSWFEVAAIDRSNLKKLPKNFKMIIKQ